MIEINYTNRGIKFYSGIIVPLIKGTGLFFAGWGIMENSPFHLAIGAGLYTFGESNARSIDYMFGKLDFDKKPESPSGLETRV